MMMKQIIASLIILLSKLNDGNRRIKFAKDLEIKALLGNKETSPYFAKSMTAFINKGISKSKTASISFKAGPNIKLNRCFLNESLQTFMPKYYL